MIRAGVGFDVHRFENNRKLILGGVNIPFDKGLKGHSDADVLIHSIMDALLGAAAKGDIGRHFPDSDQAYKNISSIKLLIKVNEIIGSEGYSVNNIDSTICAEKPKLFDYIFDMEKMISKSLNCDINLINIKATTTEGLGFVGRQEGISAYSICTIIK